MFHIIVILVFLNDFFKIGFFSDQTHPLEAENVELWQFVITGIAVASRNSRSRVGNPGTTDAPLVGLRLGLPVSGESYSLHRSFFFPSRLVYFRIPRNYHTVGLIR